MASLWLKSLLFVFTISYVYSAIININGARPELPKSTIQDIVNTLRGKNNNESGGQIESDLPDTRDEVVNEAKLICADECGKILQEELVHFCLLSCNEAVLAEILE